MTGPNDGATAASVAPHYPDDAAALYLCQCSGCGQYRSIRALGLAHACHRTEDGSYEEGGTFQ